MSFAPVYNAESRVLILGTFPSPASRSAGFYYGHPQNRFWRLMAAVLNCTCPVTVEEKRRMLLDHQIALWDVLLDCDIQGAADASIKNGVPNDLPQLLKKCDIQAIFANGGTAARLYETYWGGKIERPFYRMPSTSPANAAYRLDRLYGHWAVLRDRIGEHK